MRAGDVADVGIASGNDRLYVNLNSLGAYIERAGNSANGHTPGNALAG